MKLIRYITEQELMELLTNNIVSPKRHYIEFNNNPTNIKLNLNIKRSQLEYEDNFVTYKGYSINDIINIEIDSTVYTVTQVKQLISNKKICKNAIQKVSAGANYII